METYRRAAVLPAKGSENPSTMLDVCAQMLRGPWARPALICLAALVLLFALAGEHVNAPFVYTAPQ